jgi:hypothetical protein
LCGTISYHLLDFRDAHKSVALIVNVPWYVAGGRASDVVLICNPSVSLREPATLREVCVKIVRLRPAAKVLVPVKALNAAPFALPETLEVGMLWPAPSVNAAVALLVNAYSVIVRGGSETSHEVVIVMLESPAPTPFLGSVKFTFEGAADTVRVWPWAHFVLRPVAHRSTRTQLRQNLLRQKRVMTTLEMFPSLGSMDLR